MKTLHLIIIFSVFVFWGCRHKKEAFKNSEVNSVGYMDTIIVKEIKVGDFGGATPSLTLRKSGNAYLIVEVPPFFDGEGNEIDGDDDFPEVYVFENLLSEYIGKDVFREDREIFIIKDASEESLQKVKYFMEHYWSLRKAEFKKM